MRHLPAVITLNHPIEGHGKTLTELTLRPPTGKDIRIGGYPFRIAGSGEKAEMVTDSSVVSRLVSDLAGVPLSSVDALEFSDWQACMSALSGFLAPMKSKNSPTDTTNKPDGGETPSSSGPSPSPT